MRKHTEPRKRAARLLRLARLRSPNEDPWTLCIQAAAPYHSRFTNLTYIALREVACRFGLPKSKE